jgi:hypothetical protein
MAGMWFCCPPVAAASLVRLDVQPSATDPGAPQLNADPVSGAVPVVQHRPGVSVVWAKVIDRWSGAVVGSPMPLFGWAVQPDPVWVAWAQRYWPGRAEAGQFSVLAGVVGAFAPSRTPGDGYVPVWSTLSAGAMWVPPADAMPFSAWADQTVPSSPAAARWSDGVAGTVTIDTASGSLAGAVDAWHIAGAPHAVSQPAVTRDGSGNITARPPLAIS